ncbi:MAG: hypothetical protein H7Y32_18500, partial [Chloroflexales bacterium]|nr:hypothetical protein [Chloroflexales bacterium]
MQPTETLDTPELRAARQARKAQQSLVAHHEAPPPVVAAVKDPLPLC